MSLLGLLSGGDVMQKLGLPMSPGQQLMDSFQQKKNPMMALFPGEAMLGQAGLPVPPIPGLPGAGQGLGGLMGGGAPGGAPAGMPPAPPGMPGMPGMGGPMPGGMPEFAQGGLPQPPEQMSGFGLGALAPKAYGPQGPSAGIRERLIGRLLGGLPGGGFGE